MKILLVNDYAAHAGGAERMTFRLRDLLRARGHDARVFTSTAGGAGAADYTCAGTLGPLRTLLQSANPHAARRLRAAIDDFRPDVACVKLFLTQLSPLILPALARVPSVYHAVWYRAVCPTGTKLLPDRTPCRDQPGAACRRQGCVPLRDLAPLALQRRLWRRHRRVFRRVVANSESTRRVLSEGGLDATDVIPNGVPVVDPRPPLADPPTAIYTGRLTREKGVDVLLRAFARLDLPHARLLIAGDGPERDALAAVARDLDIAARVTWHGLVDGAALEAASAPAWAQVVPSVWAEPFGLVTAEAMMRGTAVVGSATGGTAEIVADGSTGLLVRPGDVEALAGALRRVLTDRDLAERLGRAARARALAEYREDLFAERFLAVFDAVRRA